MERYRWAGIVLVVLGLAALVWAGPALAQAPGEVTRDEINEVARELYCPTCAGINVAVCEIQACQDMRAVIATKLAAGESKEEIKRYFVAQFGQKVLAKPEQRGINLVLAWLLPGAALLAALAAALLWLRRAVAAGPPPAPAPPPLSDSYQDRLERELQRLDG